MTRIRRLRPAAWAPAAWALAAACLLPAGCRPTPTPTTADVRAMTIEDVDVARVADGTYEGTFPCADREVAVRVTVQAGEIRRARVTRNHDSPYARQAEAVIDRICVDQTPAVDVGTGASVSSKAIMKASEIALKKGLKAPAP